MDAQAKAAIERCAHDSHAGLLAFPDVLGRLLEYGVESYFADYRDRSTTYYLSGNGALRLSMQMPLESIPDAFYPDGVISAIRGAQSNTVRYPEFLRLTMRAGCIGYMVWITGKQVSYFGRRGEVHIEHFPDDGKPTSDK